MRLSKTKRRAGLAFLLLLLVTLGFKLSVGRTKEPEYGGKSLSYWLAGYRTPASLNWPRQNHASDVAIQALGTNCFPAIVARLRVRDSVARRRLTRFVRSLRLPIQISSQDSAHCEALGALGALGSTAVTLVPTLADSLESMDFSHRVVAGFWMESLGSDAEAAVPVYISILT